MAGRNRPGIGEQLLYGAFKLDQVFLSQTDLRDKGTGAPRTSAIPLLSPPSAVFKFVVPEAQISLFFGSRIFP
jgi:hypothetical protein